MKKLKSLFAGEERITKSIKIIKGKLHIAYIDNTVLILDNSFAVDTDEV